MKSGKSGKPYVALLIFLLLIILTLVACGSIDVKTEEKELKETSAETTQETAPDTTGTTSDGVDTSETAGAAGDGISERSATNPVEGVILLNVTEKHQKMDGFGTSGCWWSQDVGTWDVAVKDRISDWLFDREKGIGLTQYRFNAGAGDLNEAKDPWRRVETFETAPGVYDWSKDAASVDMLKRAVARGVDDVLIFANSPPGRMLKNGRTTGDDKGNPNLLPGMEDDFARYLVDIADHFKAEGIPVKHISPVNEPQWNWKLENGQEGCHYEPQGVLDVGRALVQELKSRSSEFDASLVDSGKMWDAKYTVELYEKLASDKEFGGWLPHFAVHAYWSNEDDKRMLAAAILQTGHDLPLWQSEWCQMEGGSDFGMDAALVLARCVHEDLTILDCTAWQTWIAVSCYDYKDGLVHVDTTAKSAVDMKRLWALGNWSRFVRPGYVRFEVESPQKELLISGWMAPDGKEIVLVAVNEGLKELSAKVGGWPETEDLSEKPVIAVWETSTAHSLEKVSETAASDSCLFPARSITTLVVR